jgi:flagellar capping protein FliD
LSGSIKWSGLASGVNFSSVVDQLIQLENITVTRLEKWKAEWETKNKSISALNTRMVSLKLNARDLDVRSEFISRSSTSSDSSKVTTVNTSTVNTGTHTVTVGENIPGKTISTSYDSTAAVGGNVGDTLTVTVGGSSITLTGVSGAPAVGEFNIDGTMDDLATAIKAADGWPGGILSNVEVVDDKDRSGTAYKRLVLTAKVPNGGPSEAITVTDPTNLSLDANSIDAVFEKTWMFSTSTATSGGVYTGSTNKTFTFAAQNSGVVGTDDLVIKWADNEGNSGSFTIKADVWNADNDTEFEVFQGVNVRFSAGRIGKAESFTIDAFNPVLQQAQDQGLARAEKRVHNGYIDLITPVHTSGTGQAAEFVYYYEGVKTVVSIPSGSKLQDLADAINNDPDNRGVKATIIDDGQGTSSSYHLILTGKDTGREHTITFGTTTSPLSNFAVSDSTFTTAQKASDSMTKIDGFPSDATQYVQRPTNTVSDVIDGLILELHGTGTATITIGNDVSSVQSKVEQLVSSVNFVLEYIRTETKYSSSGTSGVMIGNYTYDIVRNSINEIFSQRIPGLGSSKDTYVHLAQIGIHTDPDQNGIWVVEPSALKAALDNDLEAVARLFVVDNEHGSQGVASRLLEKLEKLTDSETGIANVLYKNYEGIIKNIDKKIEQEEKRIAMVRQRYEEKFARLEALLAQLEGQSTAVESQIANLPTIGKSK